MVEEQSRLTNLLEENERKKQNAIKRKENEIQYASKVQTGESLEEKMARLGIDPKKGLVINNIKKPTQSVPSQQPNNLKKAINKPNMSDLSGFESVPVVDNGCMDGILGCALSGGKKTKKTIKVNKKSRKTNKKSRKTNKKTIKSRKSKK